ncbi:MAG TPA: transketolase [Actinobacteria bacterium]|nr:transketolase [Actinomycetota bacterium]
MIMTVALDKAEIRQLTERSYKCRKNILKMMRLGEAHIGGAFSSLDILTVLYNKILNHNPKEPKWEKRDRFILSAGHKCMALYTTLADQGYFGEEVLWTYNSFNTKVPMHPDEKALPGIEFPTGSLGHGLAVGQGMAHIARMENPPFRVFVMLGDGESAEGSVWEAIMSAGHHKLDNLIAIVDRNGLQVNGETSKIMDTSVLEEKYKAFGWAVKTINGHDFNQIYNTLSGVPFVKGKPSAIIADTIKCKGLSFAEKKYEFHHWHFKANEIDDAIVNVENSCREELVRVEK